ncbi:MAG: dual specificity protein phosphatase family protein [Bdellovibrionaceae bacterium]|nr:dual specificity protein phosphatase family protein [Pseudobdellovibrionaceae bacterium]
MKAFWWYKEGSIAGMARPGFNSARWFDLNFDEAVLLGWIGQYSDGELKLSTFRQHLETYVPRIYKFHNHNDVTSKQALTIFDSSAGIKNVIERLQKRIWILKSFDVTNESIHIELDTSILEKEIQHLKTHNIQHVVTLTEHHHQKNILDNYFSTYHISIADLGTPKREQVVQLSEILKSILPKNEKLAVHCLAGIGRTSTMLIGAHILLGESFKDLETYIAKQNPSFALVEAQAEFLKTLKPVR